MLTRIFTGLCILFILTFCANANEPNAIEFIKMYEKSLAILDKSAYEIESKMELEDVQNLKGPKSVMRRSVFYRDGDRWATTAEDEYIFGDPAKSVERLHYNRIVDKRSITWSNDGNEPIRAIVIDSDLQTGKAKARAALGGAVISEGYIFGNDPLCLPDILRNSSILKVSEKRPEISGHLTYALESEGKHGKIRLWLDPEASFHPRRIEIEKSGEDLIDGKPVSVTHSNIDPNKQLEKYFVVVDLVKIEEINDVFVMTGANTTETRIYSDGYVVRASYDFKRSKINLNPDFNALHAFEIKVPDGTPVHDQDFPAGLFMVLGGKIVLDVNAPTFEEIDKMVDEIKKEK